MLIDWHFTHLVTLLKRMEVPWIVSWPSGILWSLRRHLTWIFFCSHIDENSWDARRRELNDRNKRCDEHKHSNFRCDLTCADQTALKDLSGLMVGTKSWWYDKRKARKKNKNNTNKMSSEKKDYLRCGPPGFHAAGKFGRVAFFHHKLLGTHADHWFDWKHKGWLQEETDCENACHLHLCDPGIWCSPSLASGWGKLIKEASLCWVPPSHSGNTPVHHHGCNHYLGEQW